ncbi:MAG TPA: gliding motility-associated C-terminal domain-containing protein [Bacteroidales bacterium]|nr:gliding motility-associated C-terminal domain-containing protein [Bacteroidales bacterium]HSA43804.1 gliding motility-associated C-terminal domain-containing protein [Bacteroidales bacterium]
MKKWPAFWILLNLTIISVAGEIPAGHFHYSFIENKGQLPSQVRYHAHLPHGDLYLENNGLTFSFLNKESLQKLLAYKLKDEAWRKANPHPGFLIPAHAYKVRFKNANPLNLCEAHYPYPDYKNYFLGNDPERWASHVSHYKEVIYKNIYQNIDLLMTQEEGQLKYNFLLEPGTDPALISLEYLGVEKIRIRNGRLVVVTSVNTVEELRPLAWQQDSEGKRHMLSCRFRLRNNVVGFSFDDAIDPSLPLVIDPVLIFSTYSGSVVDNWGYTATYDKDGFLYAGGAAFLQGYPTTTGAYQVNFGGGSADIAISKYDTTGSFMIYSTYLGGSGTEVPASLVVNNNNELLVMASTGSADFPVTSQAYDQTFNGGTPYVLTFILNFQAGSDIAISRLSSGGDALLSSTYLGGSLNDGLNTTAPLKHNYADDARGEIKTDNDQYIYVCSSTLSPDFPVSQGSYQTVFGGVQDACIARFDPTLTYLVWSTYLGGSAADAGYSLVINDEGEVYLAGGTASPDFPVVAPSYQQAFTGGGCDGFIACLSDQASALVHSTYYGSAAYDQLYFVDQDKNGNVYVLGQTAISGMYYIFNVSWATPGGGQIISKFNSSLSTRLLSTAFGTGNGGPDISPTAFMVDYCNYIYVSGWGSAGLNGFGGTAGLPVTANAFQTTTDNNDYYFLVLEGDASGLIYATYFGGSAAEHVDGGTSRFDKKGRIYQSVCAGCGGYDDFPTTPGAWSNVNGSTNCNNAVIKYNFNIPLAVADFISPPSGCAPYTVSFVNTSQATTSGNVQYFWDFGDATTSTLKDPVHTFTQPGSYLVSLIISDSESCNQADTIQQMVHVLGNPSFTLTPANICPGESVQIGINPIPDPSITYYWGPAFNLNNPFLPNPIASPSATITYTLLITNGLCSDTAEQTVFVHEIEAHAGNDTVVCQADITLTAHGVPDSLSFIWSSSSAFLDTLNAGINNPVAQVTLTGQSNWFYLMAFDDYCNAIDSVNISFSILVSPAGGQNPLCPDSCNGIAMVEVNGGSPPYQFLWSNGQTLDSIGNLCAGSYTVTITDSAACISIAGIVLTEPPPFSITPEITHVPCDAVCNGSISITAAGGTPPYTWAWNNGQQTQNIENLCAGNYQLLLTDSLLCPYNADFTVSVESSFDQVSLAASPDTVYQGVPVQLTATLLPGCTYAWQPSQYLSRNDIPDPVALPPLSTTFTVTITDPWGCVFTDSVKVVVLEVFCREPYIYVPNAFSPNNDRKNDLLLVQSPYIESMQLFIYDRWGNKVFETRDPAVGWDGTWQGKACEQGVYVYYIEAGCFNKETFKKKGNITLIR